MFSLNINADALIMALESHEPGLTRYLDFVTGKIFAVLNDPEGELKTIESKPDRYRRIEPLHSSISYKVMADFVETLPAGRERHDLENALRQRQPFRHFRNTLLNYPKIRGSWHLFHHTEFEKLARKWLTDNRIEATLRLWIER